MAILFRGEFDLRVDDKSRVAVPAAFQRRMDVAGQRGLVIVKSFNAPCLEVWSEAAWSERELEIRARLGKNNPDALNLLRYVGPASAEPDSHGRMVLPPVHRAHAAIEPGSEIHAVGMIEWFELWSRSHWEAQVQQNLANQANWAASLVNLGL